MAYGIIMEFDGATLENYDGTMEDMQLGGVLPSGALFHAAGTGPNGLVVCDVWEDMGAFEAFRDAKIGPLSAKNGITSPPRVRVVEGDVRVGAPGDVGFMQIVTLPGVDAETFAKLDAEVVGPERNAPDGCVFHISGAVGGDLVILDYWTSAEVHDAFIANQVAPVMQAHGVAAPNIEGFAVHNSLTGSAVAS